MNVSAAGSPIPDIGSRQDLVVSKQSEADVAKAEIKLIPETTLSNEENTKYKYYVLPNGKDFIYNNNKSTEKINTWVTGSLIDVYA